MLGYQCISLVDPQNYYSVKHYYYYSGPNGTPIHHSKLYAKMFYKSYTYTYRPNKRTYRKKTIN